MLFLLSSYSNVPFALALPVLLWLYTHRNAVAKNNFSHAWCCYPLFVSARLQSPKVRLGHCAADCKVWELSGTEIQLLNKGPKPQVENGILDHSFKVTLGLPHSCFTSHWEFRNFFISIFTLSNDTLCLHDLAYLGCSLSAPSHSIFS